MKNRTLLILLCILLTAACFPASDASAAGYYDYSQLDCTDCGANYLYASYMNQAMEYRIENSASLRTSLNNGNTIVFVFEGGSSQASPDYNDDTTPIRTAALLLVVKLVNGKPKITYWNNKSNSFPDLPTETSNNFVNPDTGAHFADFKCFSRGWGPGTLKDGVYPYAKSSYPVGDVALYLYSSYTVSIYVNPKSAAGYTEEPSDEIYVHYGVPESYRSTAPNTRRYSVGCINVGNDKSQIKTLVNNCTAYGYVVVDRQLYVSEMVDIWSNNGNGAAKARATVNAIKAKSDAVAAAIVTGEPGQVELTASAQQTKPGTALTWTAASAGGDMYFITVYNEDTGAAVIGPLRMTDGTRSIALARAGHYQAVVTVTNPAGCTRSEPVSFLVYKQGDVNGDGAVDLQDVSSLFRMKTGEQEADSLALERVGISDPDSLTLRTIAEFYQQCTQ